MPWEALLLLAVGAAAGFLSGLLGIGGGILMVPVLHYLLGRPWPEAVALSLLAIALQSPLGLARHAGRGAVRVRLAVPMALGVLVGVAAGDQLIQVTPVAWLKLVFALLMGWAAYRLVAHAPRPGDLRPRTWLLLLLGTAAGLAGRLFGIGGGLVTVPVLMRAAVPAHTAVGSSLLPVFVTAAVASAANLARGMDLSDGVLLGLGALAGVLGGVRSAHALPEQGLRRTFAGALALAALYVAATSGV